MRDPAGRVHPEVPRAPLQVGAELLAGDPDGTQRIVVGIEGQHLAPANRVGVEAGPEVERGAGGEVGAGPAALHLEDEILDRRWAGPGIAGSERRRRISDGLIHPGLDRDMARLEPLGQQRRHRPIRDRQGLATDPGDVPSAFDAAQVDMNDGDAARVPPRLDEVHPVEHRVGHLAMGVTDDDDVRPHRERCQRCRDILGPDPGRVVAGGTIHAAVDQHHRDVGRLPHRLHGGGRRPVDRRHSEGTLEQAPVPEHHAGRGEAGDGDPHAFALEHAERREGERIAPLGVDVGADIGERGITDRTEQAIDAEIEIVVPGRDGIVAHQVHRLDDRMRRPRPGSSEVRRERISLEQISRIEHDDLPGIATPEGIHDRSHPREPAGRGPVRDVIPAGRAAMHVGGRDEHDMGTIRNLGDDERRCEQQGEHWPGNIEEGAGRRYGATAVLGGARGQALPHPEGAQRPRDLLTRGSTPAEKVPRCARDDVRRTSCHLRRSAVAP